GGDARSHGWPPPRCARERVCSQWGTVCHHVEWGSAASSPSTLLAAPASFGELFTLFVARRCAEVIECMERARGSQRTAAAYSATRVGSSQREVEFGRATKAEHVRSSRLRPDELALMNH